MFAIIRWGERASDEHSRVVERRSPPCKVSLFDGDGDDGGDGDGKKAFCYAGAKYFFLQIPTWPMLHLYQGCLPQQMAPYYKVCKMEYKRGIVLMTWNQLKMSSAGDGGVANNSLQAPPKIEQSLQVQKIFRGIKNGFTEKNQLFSKNYFQAVSPMETCWIW